MAFEFPSNPKKKNIAVPWLTKKKQLWTFFDFIQIRTLLNLCSKKEKNCRTITYKKNKISFEIMRSRSFEFPSNRKKTNIAVPWLTKTTKSVWNHQAKGFRIPFKSELYEVCARKKKKKNRCALNCTDIGKRRFWCVLVWFMRKLSNNQPYIDQWFPQKTYIEQYPEEHPLFFLPQNTYSTPDCNNLKYNRCK